MRLLALLIALAATTLMAAGDDLNGAPSWPTEEFHFARMYYDNGGAAAGAAAAG